MPSKDKKDVNSLNMPFFGFLSGVGMGHFKNPYYFETGTLFWSLTRLFECYFRIMSAVSTYKEAKRDPIFLANDLENFIIRHNIIMNDVAFLIRKFYPTNAKGMPNPKGGVHPMNREQSFNDLLCFFKDKDPNYHPMLSNALSSFVSLTSQYIRIRRQDIIHYQAKILIFQGDELTFAFMDPANTTPTTRTENGGERIVSESVFNFVNDTMVNTLNFINKELVRVYSEYIEVQGWECPIILDTSMKCIGINPYKEINNLA